MKPLFKLNLNDYFKNANRVILDIGCGNKKIPGAIGIDIIDLPDVDIVANIEDGLKFLQNNTVDEINCNSILEHIENFNIFIEEMVRVMKPSGVANVFVPHFSNPHFYSDPTHLRSFGLYTFHYYVNETKQLRRKVPNFYTSIRINIISNRLVFKSFLKFGTPMNAFCNWFFNINKNLQEFYEARLSWLLPCCGIQVQFGPIK